MKRDEQSHNNIGTAHKTKTKSFGVLVVSSPKDLMAMTKL
jgi:hypothetical protein